MTSDPKAPDAAAVFLNREEIVDDKTHFHRLYARIKILTEKGKEEYSDIEIPYEAGVSDIRAVEGRTIHADGTIVPFTGKPYSKELVKAGDVKIMEKVFSMPDVQVGSILEYRWELAYDDGRTIPPNWLIQQPIYVHQAHFHFVPFDMSGSRTVMVTDSLGKTNPANRLLYYHELPPGAEVKEGLNGFDLAVNDIPPLPEEEYSPPLSSFSYRVIFYYSPAYTGEEYWKEEGKVWSKDVDRFANPSDVIRQAVAQIVAPTDTEDQKLQKIYNAVMQIENTRFTREHSAAENKAAGLRVKTAADIWTQKRGSDDEITRLFISMARAVGLKAYAMIVTERNRNLLNPYVLDWDQFEDEIAIVTVGGKERAFDPGQRYCEYGKLHWMHTQVVGVRQSDRGPEMAVTPKASYSDNAVGRIAELELGPDGSLKGVVRISMSGEEALRWRQEALRSDEAETKRDFENELQSRVADGVHVKMNHFLGLSDPASAFMAVVDVSGNMGTATGKRVFLPADFFETNVKLPFSGQKRESAVDLHYPYLAQDHITITLPPGMSVQSVPPALDIPFPKNAEYKVSYTAKDNTYEMVRLVGLVTAVYKQEDYPQLRDFYGKMGAQDQQQVILDRPVVTAAQ
jgi:transglutaminase-like putative cysteine protease